MAITYNRYKFATVSLLARLRNDLFTPETATWIQKWFKIPEALLITVFQGGHHPREP
jgi:hypothetical protein